jgi:hypothetical protein
MEVERAHSRRRRLLGFLIGTVAVASIAVVAHPAAASAQSNGSPFDGGVTGGGNTSGASINGWSALYMATHGSGGSGTVIPCTLRGTTDSFDRIETILNAIFLLAGVQPLPWDDIFVAGLSGHLEWKIEGAGIVPDIVRGGLDADYHGAVYSVMCVPDIAGINLRWDSDLFGELINTLIDVNFIDFAFVPPGGPEVAYQAELESLIPNVPVIVTEPSPGERSLVALDTWLAVQGDIWDGEVKTWSHAAAGVTVNARLWADPAELVFDPGDGSGVVPCGEAGVVGHGAALTPATTCKHPYLRASEGYDVTATVTFTGGFALTGSVNQTWAPLSVTRIGEVTLPVNQGEAIVEE